MAAANGDRDQVLQKSRDLRFLTGFETKVRRHWRSRGRCPLGGARSCLSLLGELSQGVGKSRGLLVYSGGGKPSGESGGNGGGGLLGYSGTLGKWEPLFWGRE